LDPPIKSNRVRSLDGLYELNQWNVLSAYRHAEVIRREGLASLRVREVAGEVDLLRDILFAGWSVNANVLEFHRRAAGDSRPFSFLRSRG